MFDARIVANAEEVIALYDDGTEIDGELVYVPKTLGAGAGLHSV
jgi:hypothetical protein